MAAIGRFQKGDEIFYAKVVDGELFRLRGDVFGSPSFDKKATPFQGLKTLTPVAPSKIIAIGLNYADHARETGKPLPKEPLFWLKAPTSLIARWRQNRNPLSPSPHRFRGRTGHCHRSARAQRHPRRRLALHLRLHGRAGHQRPDHPEGGKPVGALPSPSTPSRRWGLTSKRRPTRRDLTIQLFQNGQLRQNSNTSQLIFNCSQLVSFVSTNMTLLPGDVILTGTPSGVGPIQSGDRLEVRIQGLAPLVNSVK